MTKVVGVKFRNVGKMYYFDPKEFEMKRGDHVIVETARGIEYGRVVMEPRDIEDSEVNHPLKEVLRMASEEDNEREKENRLREREAFVVCKKKILEHNLDMKLIDAEYTFDNNKILFYFTADGRIDFRQLVKDLAAIFKTRIELRQIGVRDETKILGGIGICGRCLCCHSYLSDFVPVSIKMAKEQNLSLNQTKISGVCGRLMCCLKNEQETYEELNRSLPGIGDAVTVPNGTIGTVHSVNVLRQLVKVVVETGDEKEIQEYAVSDLKFRPRRKKGKVTEQELREMEESEEKSFDDRQEERRKDNKKNENRQKDKDSRRNEKGERSRENRDGSDRRNSEKDNSDREKAEKETSNRGNSGKKNADRGNTEKGNTESGNSERGSSERGNSERGNSERGNAERGSQERGNQERGNREDRRDRRNENRRKDPSRKEGSAKENSAKESFAKEGSVKEGSVKESSVKGDESRKESLKAVKAEGQKRENAREKSEVPVRVIESAGEVLNEEF